MDGVSKTCENCLAMNTSTNLLLLSKYYTLHHLSKRNLLTEFGSLDIQVFGLGKHACPGRFFASNEIKVLLCRIILDYDMKLLDGTTRPANDLVSTTMNQGF